MCLIREVSLVCAECGELQKSIKGLSRHAYWRHGLTSQQYYDKYLKQQDTEGICLECGKDTQFLSLREGYQEFCCVRCSNTNADKNSRTKKVLSERTGDRWKEIQQKQAATCQERYGGVGYASEFLKKKAQDTLEAVYGDRHYHNLEKAKQTCLEHFGVECIFQQEDFHERSLQVKKERYGCGNNLEKVRQTNQALYGVDYVSQIPDSKVKSAQTKRDKSWNSLKSLLFEQGISLLSYSDDDIATLKCDACGNEFTYAKTILYAKVHVGKICPVCYPRAVIFNSNLQNEVVNYIQSIYSGSISLNNRQVLDGGLELDIYLPDRAIAFEIDGLFWHSIEYKSPDYHLKKTEDCECKEIQLIHIFESDWESFQDITKSRIRSLLGKPDTVIYARKCEVKKVSKKDAKSFLEQNHLQGYALDSARYGLYYQNELISLMTFGKPRFNKKYQWELIRFCNRTGFHIPGAASKLLRYFEKDKSPKSLVSYADRRWSKGTLYQSLGFSLIGISKPNYWYFRDSTHLENRINYQKHKLSDKLELFDSSLTEQENMLRNGFNIIYDCGNLIYGREYP